MALGIDIYRYQTVTDWNAVKQHGVAFVYVKGTDGFGQALVRADGQVKGAQHAGIPVGLYHYAQLGEPRRQANVLVAEVKRLGATGLPPVLDLEDPHTPGAAAREFALDFLDELHRQGFNRVCLYANTSMLTGIQAATLNVPGLVIWEANYGSNDGRRYGLPSRPWRRDIHQYTSVGTVPGITGRVDLNESLTPLGGNEVELTDKIRFWDGFEITVGQALADTWQLANNLSGRATRPGKPADTTPWVLQLLAEVTNDPDLTAERIGEIVRENTQPVDPAALAAQLLPALQETLAGLDTVSDADAAQIAQATVQLFAAQLGANA